MKSLIKKAGKSSFGIALRNLTGYRSVFLNNNYKLEKTASISDAFAWRTDNGYETIFRFSDILNLFYNIDDSIVEITIYSNSNKLLKKILIENIDLSNELLIDTKLLSGLESFGVFYIFHRFKDPNIENLVISNKCYVGFSKNGSLPSFVHGMSYVRYKTLDNKKYVKGLIQSSFFKKKYRVQKSFAKFQKTEFFIVNPTPKKLRISICNKIHTLDVGHSILLDIMQLEDVYILSNCLFLRPMIFNYNDGYFDVFHG